MRRRGLVAGVAAGTAALFAFTSARNPEVAYAADGTFDNLNITGVGGGGAGKVNITVATQNQFADIHTTTNIGGMRYYNAATLTESPDGAAIQFWGNGSGLPGQAYIDAGANDQGAVIFRTAPTGGTITERFRINATGTTTVTGDIAISGMKQFVIDHPLDPDNKYLYHSVVEGPEQFNVYTGNVKTDGSNQAVVTLPSYFEAINRDFRYQLTALGTFAQAIVASPVQNNQFTIRTDKPGVDVSWQVWGVRNDVHARSHPFVAERPKTGAEVGSRFHPEDYNLPQDRSRGNRLSPTSISNGPGTNNGSQPSGGQHPR
jgi:hypothetical protein